MAVQRLLSTTWGKEIKKTICILNYDQRNGDSFKSVSRKETRTRVRTKYWYAGVY